MASSHTGTSTHSTLGGQYRVFLSFCGDDTRRGFANTVYHALSNAGINVFIDEEGLEPGGRISSSLPQAIDDSRVYIPIFSKNFASRHWCLRELAKMVENTSKSKEDGDQKVILPIFYDVSVEDVKLNTPVYKDAILKLEQTKKFDSEEEIARWRQALKNVCGYSGFELKNTKGDGHLSDSVVEEVLKKLQTRQRKVTADLVGMENQIAGINKLLGMESGDVRLIGICGMGGMGKTTLAKVIFNQLCAHFGKYCSFLDDVKERAKTKGLIELQKQLLSDISNSGGPRNIVNTDDGIKAIGETIRNKKVLIVLDDVDEITQIQNLIEVNSLHSGTRILVTTRDKDVLNIRRFEFEEYEMVGLSDKDALQLFSRHAFDANSPLPDYVTLSKGIVSTAGGLPLALEAIGASLFHKKERKIWEEMLEKLKKIPNGNVLGKLQITYDTLELDHQQIFLDIACLFIGYDKTDPIYMWKGCGFYPEYAITVLNNRCMVKVLDNNKFWMHDQFRDLGKAISDRERSRIWARDDVIHELTSTSMEINTSVQALFYEDRTFNHPMSGSIKRTLDKNHTTVIPEQIKRFLNLRLLRLRGVTFQGDFAGCLSKLKWIDLFESSDQFTATNLNPENVVVMAISGYAWREDAVISLVEGAKKVKALTLNVIQLRRTPTFSEDSILEKLTFNYCRQLKEIDCSIGKLQGLTDLTVEWSEALQKLPEQISELKRLQHLSLRHCKGITELPDSVSKLKSLTKLDVSDSGISRLPDSIGTLQSLSSLVISRTGIVKLPETMSNLSQLHELVLWDSVIQELPKLPESLTTLQLSSRSLQTVPDLSNLTNLVTLFLSDGTNFFENESSIIQPCDLPWIGGGLSKLRKMDLCLLNVHATPTDWASLTLLEELHLKGLKLQTPKQLSSNLRVLTLRKTRVEQVELDGLPQLEELTIDGFELITRILIPSSSRKLRQVAVISCNELVEVQFLGVLESMERLYISECESLERLVCLSEEAGCNELQATELTDCSRRVSLVSSSLKALKELDLWTCPELQEIRFVSALELLEDFHVRGCIYLRRLGGLSNLKNLKGLRIQSCESLEVVEGIDALEHLEELSIDSCRSMGKIIDASISKVPEECAIWMRAREVVFKLKSTEVPELTDGSRRESLKTLKYLELWVCTELQEIQFVSALESLERFVLDECSSLKRLGGLSNLKNLKVLEIEKCKSLQLVEGINELECLEELTVQNCRSMGKIIDASSSKVPKECDIWMSDCGEVLNTDSPMTWECYREKILNNETTSSEWETETGDPPSEEQDDGNEDDHNEADGMEDEDDEDNNVHEVLQPSRRPPPVSSMGNNDENNNVTEEGKGDGDGNEDRIRTRKRGTMKKRKKEQDDGDDYNDDEHDADKEDNGDEEDDGGGGRQKAKGEDKSMPMTGKRKRAMMKPKRR